MGRQTIFGLVMPPRYKLASVFGVVIRRVHARRWDVFTCRITRNGRGVPIIERVGIARTLEVATQYKEAIQANLKWSQYY